MKPLSTLLALFLLTSTSLFSQKGLIKDIIKKDQYNKHGKPGEDKLNQWLGGKVLNINPKEEYSFPFSMNQHIITYKKGKPKDEMDMRMYFNIPQKTYAIEGNQMEKSNKKNEEKIITVFDAENALMLIYNLTQKTLLGMNLNAFKSKATIEAEKNKTNSATAESDFKCDKTGKTKKILGYNCWEMICKSEAKKNSTQMWVTSEIKLNGSAYSSPNLAKIYGSNAGLAGGTVLEINNYNEDGELETSMTVTDINQKENLRLITAEYKRTQFEGVNFQP